MRFEENVGQTDGQVRFIGHGPGYVVFLTPGESVFKFSGQTAKPHTRANHVSMMRNPPTNQGAKPPAVLRMKMEGARGTPTITGLEKQPGVSNYLIGNDPTKWRKGVTTYGKVQYTEVYSGIDLVYYGNQHQLEYDFVVKPGADPGQVIWSFDGARNVSLDSAGGNVVLDTAAGKMALRKPVIYQVENGQQRRVQGNYKFQGNGRLAFDVKDYDRTQPLVIDPVLVYSTYLGGSSDDGGYGLTVDSQGHAFLTGYTDSTDFPIAGTSLTSPPSGNFEAFVAELSSDGNSLIYSTYLGGSGGDFGSNIALDSADDAYVVGNTSSTNFPVTSNAFQSSLVTGAASNAFLSKLSPDGQSLLYSTYLGGGGTDYGFGIAVDGNQNAYITGETTSGSPTPFPTTSNAFQSTLNSPYGNGFVSRIDTQASGVVSLVYSTFLGGTTPSAYYWDQGTAIAVDANQNVYVVGMVSSLDFPITSSTAYQTRGNINGNAYLTRIDTTKSGSAGLIYSTYFGGTGSTDQAASVALDSAGKVYLTGGTGSSDFPVTTNVTNSGEGKGFVAKFDTTLSQSASLLYSTLVGGSSGEFSGGIAVDPLGNAYISGWTFSSDFPVTSDAVQSTKGTGVNNSFLAVLSTDASKILYGTYLGGNGSSNLTEYAYGLALDSGHNIYITGGTGSPDFQTTSGTIQTSLNGSSDAFVAKLTALPIPMISSLSQLSGPDGVQVTINGSNFGSSQGTSTVTFGADTAPIVTWGDTAIVAQVPSAAPLGLLQVTVTTSLEPSNSEPFIVTTSSPYIDSLSPTSGAPGTLVTITGSQFGVSQGQGVFFNGVSATIGTWSDTNITARVPAGASTGSVTVANGSNLTSNGVNFTVPLIVTGSSSNSGPVGASISINGTGFGATQGSSTVSFNGTVAGVSTWGASNIVAVVPSGATTGSLVVTVSSTNSNGLNFTVLPSPAISSLSPTSGPVTTAVTISGTGFGATQGSSSVTFNGVAAAISSWSATSITPAVPVGAATGNVVVTLDGVPSNGANFTVTAPTLASLVITPATPSILNGKSLQFTATGVYVDGSTQNLTSSATWSSSDSTVATISASGLSTAVALGTVTIQATAGALSGSTTLNVVSTTSMNTARHDHTATLLNTGKVLVAGGIGSPNTVLTTAELYDPSTGSFSFSASSLNTPRADQTATLLNDGTVLFAGGWQGNDYTARAEIYNPITDTFTPTGSLNIARAYHTATLLNDGTVLIAGGFGDSGDIATAELYVPATGSFTTQVGPLNTARDSHTATLLNDGTVLVVGGYDNSGSALGSAELYNPSTGNFAQVTATLATARISHTATPLNGGKVLIAGGMDTNYSALNSAEVYDPVSQAFSAAATMNFAHLYHTATLLNNGTVLIGSGISADVFTFVDSELYDPVANTFTDQGRDPRYSHTSTLLNNGTVLSAGGWTTTGDFNIPQAQSALYTPTSVTPTGLVSIAINPAAPSFLVGLTQNFVATGTFSDSSTEVLSSATWSTSDNTLSTVTNDSTNRGHAFALATGSPTITACAGSVCGSTVPSLTASQLTVSGLFPAFGGVGTVVSIVGTGFGGTHGTSAVTFNGVTASIVSSTATGIVAIVPSGAATGNVVVTVASTSSNAVPFTIYSSPVITSLSPTTGGLGTSVTISGSNFGATTGRTVNFNGGTGAISNWSDTSIVTSVPATAMSGNLTVTTANGLTSNAISFAVPLVVTNLNPASGPVGTMVAISGSSFGATQGSSSASINGTPLTIVTWSDTQIFGVVASGTTTGTVSVQVGANIASGPTFTVTSAFQYKVQPQSISLLVGQTTTLSVTNSNGAPVIGLQWVTSDPTIVSLSTDDPPVLTGVAPGSASVSVAGIPVSVTVYAGTSLPAGTPIWSLPLGGSSELGITPAVPSSSGVDVFALDNAGTLSAISSDGRLTWQGSLGASTTVSSGGTSYLVPTSSVIPDFSGNVFLKNRYTYTSGYQTHNTHVVQAVDPVTHVATTLYTFSDQVQNCCVGPDHMNDFYDDDSSVQTIIPDTTGMLFVQDNGTVTVINPSKAQTVATASAIAGNNTYSPQGTTSPSAPVVGKMIVAGDGNAYLPYSYTNSSTSHPSETELEIQYDSHLMLLQIAPDGTSSNVELRAWTQTYVDDSGVIPPGMDPNQVTGYRITYTESDNAVLGSNDSTAEGSWNRPYAVITNSNVGAAVFATLVSAPCATQYVYTIDGTGYGQESDCPNITPSTLISYVSQGALASQVNIPSLPNFIPVLQREDGSYIGVDTATQAEAVGLDGGILWQKTFSTAGGAYVTPLYATSDGGVIVTSTTHWCPGGDIVFPPTVSYPSCQMTNDQVSVALPYLPQGQLGALYTLDQYGNIVVNHDQNGNIIPPPPDAGATYSWTNNWYADAPGTISSFAFTALDLADSWWGIWQGNSGATRTAQEQQWFPPLPSCHDANLSPPIACPGPQEILYSAFGSLTQLLPICTSCKTNVFDKINGAYTAPFKQPFQRSLEQFHSFLTNGASLFDGTRSTFRMDFLNCGGYGFLTLDCLFDGTKIRDWMKTNKAVAVTQPAERGLDHLLSFFDPRLICSSQVINEANLFHEGLHGDIVGADDGLLEKVFGIQPPSINISSYIEDNALGGGPHYNVAGGNPSCPN